MFGVGVAIITVYYNNRFLGKLVRKLIEIDATSEDTALTPEELGVKITPFVKYALRPETSFSKTVLTTSDGKYYIAPDKVSMAKSKYSGKEASLGFVIVCVLLLLLVTGALLLIFPDVVDAFVQRLSDFVGERSEI